MTPRSKFDPIGERDRLLGVKATVQGSHDAFRNRLLELDTEQRQHAAAERDVYTRAARQETGAEAAIEQWRDRGYELEDERAEVQRKVDNAAGELVALDQMIKNHNRDHRVELLAAQEPKWRAAEDALQTARFYISEAARLWREAAAEYNWLVEAQSEHVIEVEKSFGVNPPSGAVRDAVSVPDFPISVADVRSPRPPATEPGYRAVKYPAESPFDIDLVGEVTT
jgi:chromosome segregation ATPase